MDFQTFYNEHFLKVKRYCFYLAKNNAEAEDLGQETFLKAWQIKEQVSKIESPTAWLFTIARNLYFDRYRAWKRLKLFIQNQPESKTDNISDFAISLKKAILTLPEQQREVFVLRHIFEFDTAETAKLLNISEGTVKSHLSRAIEKIAKIFDNEF